MPARIRGLAALAFIALPFAAGAVPLNILITTTQQSPQPVGTNISISATVIGDSDPSPAYEYSFGIASKGNPPDVRRGFGRQSTWVWTPSAFEGPFTIWATVKNKHSGNSGTASLLFTLNSRLVNGAAAVNNTSNPLVALFSGPACLKPNSMRVRSTPTSTPTGGIVGSTATTAIPCRADAAASVPDLTSMNFYVAGLYPNTRTNMHWEVIDTTGTVIRTGIDLQFNSGSIPSSVNLPQFSHVGNPSAINPIVMNSPILIPVGGRVFASSATDLSGNVLWYSTNVPPVRTEFGGSYWGFIPGTDDYIQGIREVSLAGDAISETTVGAVNEQLLAMGKPPITSFHHEVRRIYTGKTAAPNGYILALASLDKASTSAQGGTPAKPVDIIGDMIVVLDNNLNVVWTWNSFDFLDTNQPAILGEQCTQPAGAGCPPFKSTFSVGNDWLHSNSAQYTAYDGNIVVSMRHQDAVIKVSFGNGAGDGHIIWKLGHGPIGGAGGAALPTIPIFTNMTNGTHDLAFPWFSHQHDAEFELGGAVIGGARILTLFDNGNLRQATVNPNANSRCQLFAVNESALVANLNLNADVGTYSFAVGSAQLLSNGNVVCDSGFIGGFAAATTNPRTETTEANSSGLVFYGLNAAQDTYRTLRMQNMYTPVTP